VWSSSPVTCRLSPTTLCSRSGSTYHLVGALDRAEMRNPEGSIPVSDCIASKFVYGFPRNWEKLVCMVESEVSKWK